MLALKIFLFIILFLLMLITLLLLLPLGVELQYKDEFNFCVKYCKIRLFDSRKDKKVDKEKEQPREETPQKKSNFIKKAYDKYGLMGAVKHFTGLLRAIFKKISWVFRKIKIRDFKMFLSVTANNAADCAIEYGAVCAAVYPTLAGLFSVTDCKAKKIDIIADYDGKSPRFEISLNVSAPLIFLLIAAIGAFSEYKKYEKV